MAGISFQPNVNNVGYGTIDPSQGKVLDRHLTAPPGAPAVGARYIVASVATGAWAGKENYIAEYSAGLSWDFTAPTEGMTCWIDDENVMYFYDGSAWDLADKQFDHGSLKGLTDDDHTDYLTSGRADTWLAGKTQDNLADGTNYKQFSAAQKIALTGITTTRGEPTGFENRTDSTLSWNSGTNRLTLTGTFNVWCQGVKHAKTTEYIDVTPAYGLTYIFYNASGVLTQDVNWPGFGSCLVASVFFDFNSLGTMADERHGIIMDSATHDFLHSTVGARYKSGLGATFADTTLSVDPGKMNDEDIEISIGTSSPLTTCRKLHRTKSSGVYYWTIDDTYNTRPYLYTTAGGGLTGDLLGYDNDGAIAELSNNEFVASWVFATNDPNYPLQVIVGQRKDTTIANARANNTYESLSLGTLPYKEMKLLYRVLYKQTAGGPSYQETQDYRSVSNLPAGTYVATNHGVLTGLTNDDHTQYHNDTRGDARYYLRTNIYYQGYFNGQRQDPPGTISGRYRIIGTPTGAWAGKAGYLVQPNSAGSDWEFIAPLEGMIYYDDNTGTAVLMAYDGSAWNRAEAWLLNAQYLQGFINSSAGVTDAGKPIKLDSSGKIDSSLLASTGGGSVQVIRLTHTTGATVDSTTKIPANAVVLWAKITFRYLAGEVVTVGHSSDADKIFTKAELDAIVDSAQTSTYTKYFDNFIWNSGGSDLELRITSDATYTTTVYVGYSEYQN